MLRDKLGKWGRQAGREVRGRAVDVRNRSQGMVHEAKSALGVRDQGSAEVGRPEMGSPSSWPPADSTTSGQPDWTGTAGLEGRGEQGSSSGPVGVMGQPAVGAAVGAGAAEPGGAEYGDLTHEPAGQNGRDNIG